jgi:hypothetical protein
VLSLLTPLIFATLQPSASPVSNPHDQPAIPTHSHLGCVAIPVPPYNFPSPGPLSSNSCRSFLTFVFFLHPAPSSGPSLLFHHASFLAVYVALVALDTANPHRHSFLLFFALHPARSGYLKYVIELNAWRVAECGVDRRSKRTTAIEAVARWLQLLSSSDDHPPFKAGLYTVPFLYGLSASKCSFAC